MKIDGDLVQQLRKAISDFDFPIVAFDFEAQKEKNGLKSYPMLEKYIQDMLLSDDCNRIKNGLSNVLYWGYATSPGRQWDRVKRFRSQVTNHQLSDFSEVIREKTAINLFDVRDCQLPQFSRVSFISKILMFTDPLKFVTLDLQIGKIKNAEQPSIFKQLIIYPTYLPVNKNNQLFYVSWCKLCHEIADECFSANEIRAVDVERGIFTLVRRGKIELAARMINQAEQYGTHSISEKTNTGIPKPSISQKRDVMNTQNTLYIAEPIFSEKLQKFDPESSFPPIKKIGITTNHPKRREKELLGTISPIKISIVKAWTGINARVIESMLHNILDNLRLDGEYFWDGNETLVDAVSEFISTYHSDAKEIRIADDSDVKAASDAAIKKSSQRIYSEVVPELEELDIEYKITKSEKGVRFRIGDYRLHIGGKTGGRYTLTIWSSNKTTEDALLDFKGSQELSAHGIEDSSRRARIPMAKLETIISSIKQLSEKMLNQADSADPKSRAAD